MKDQINQTFKMLRLKYGYSIFTDTSRFKEALADILSGFQHMPEGTKKAIRNLLTIAICDMEAYERLQNGSSTLDALVNQMSQDYMIEQTASEMVIGCINESLAHDSDSLPAANQDAAPIQEAGQQERNAHDLEVARLVQERMEFYKAMEEERAINLKAAEERLKHNKANPSQYNTYTPTVSTPVPKPAEKNGPCPQCKGYPVRRERLIERQGFLGNWALRCRDCGYLLGSEPYDDKPVFLIDRDDYEPENINW